MGFTKALVTITFSFSFSFTLCVLSATTDSVKHQPPCKFPAIYNFGDSNSDTGGISAAFYPAGPPSGNTFFHKPAGRGSDGRLIIDFFAEKLKLPYLGAYLDSLAPTFRHGANFATGGATVRWQNKTQRDGVSPFSLDIQTAHYYQFKTRSTDMYKAFEKGSGAGSKGRLPRPEDFSKALYTFDIGQNDLAAGFQQGHQQLLAAIPDIIEQLARSIQQLYDLGGRAFWVHNTGPIGCLPVTTHYYHNPTSGVLDQSGCLISENEIAQEFNKQLKDRVDKLRTQLQFAAITYVDVFAAKSTLIGNAKVQGFVESSEICCGMHSDSVHVYCGNKAMLNGTEIYAGSCEDPSRYISWDGVHYTEAANHWVANHLVNGSFSDPPVPITHACHRL